MRLSIRPGRSRVLAIAASLLLSGAALAATTVPAQAAPPPPGLAGVTVTNPGPTTKPLETPIDLPLTATDTNPAAYPLTWSAPALTLLGLTIGPTNADGTEAAITGTVPAAEAGTYDITVTATDADLADGTAKFELTLANTVAVTNPGAQVSPPGAAITPLAIHATDTDTAPTVTFTYAAPDLPAGLAINPATGVITGTPTIVGVTDVSVTATDDTGATGTAVFAWTVGNKVTVTVPKAKATWLGLAASVQATAADSDKSQTIKWSAKPLPPGLSISKTGLISGRTKATGLFKTVVTATDGIGSAGSATIDWNVGTPITVSSPGAVAATAGRSVAYKLTYADVVKGDKVAWTAVGLPAGMGFQPSSLLLYGWPGTVGTHTVVFRARGSLGTSDQKVLKLVVKAAPDKGATGQIRLALDGKCLQDPGNHTANGTRVELEPCVSGATERWTVASDNTVRVNGRCLNISGSGKPNGKQLQLLGCTGGPRQVWLQGTAGVLVNPASGLCVTDPGASRKNGITPTMGACHIKSYEEWTLPAQPILTPVGGKCADDPLAVGSNGTVVDMYNCNGTPGQAWAFEPDGTIRISQYPHVCLTDYKSKPELWLCSAGNKNQKWSIVRTGGLSVALSVRGACLGTKSLTAANAAKLVIVKCAAANPLDLWHIE